MKTLILTLVAVFTAMELYASETTAEASNTDNPLVKEVAKGLDEKVSKPTQEMKNLNEAVERLAIGKASEADKELIKNSDEPFIKMLQESTIYPFRVDIDDPIYHTLATFYASIPSAASAMVDLYMMKHCTNDLSKMTMEESREASTTQEWGRLISMKYSSFKSSENTYAKFVQAVRAFNCNDHNAFRDYVDVETVEATVLTNYDTQKSASQIMEFSFQNIKGIECHVFGETYKIDNGKFFILVKKQKCGIDAEKEAEGSVWPFVDNAENHPHTTFSSLKVGDKVNIFKTK